MTFSMTAFARTDSQTVNGAYSWEIRSVNSRYLELHFRLPEPFRAIESALRDTLRSTLSRGKIECHLKFTPNETQQFLTINEDLVARINEAADQVHAVIGPGNALNALDILKWPGVIKEGAVDMKTTSEDALSAFNDGLSQLIHMREREGHALSNFIAKRLAAIYAELNKVKAELPKILIAQRQHLESKLADLVSKVNAERLEQEMVLILQKADVEEELDRLHAHLEEVERILKQSGPIGRRLDFMMQELNREANTLSSKSISHLTTQISVELKVLIEQMREQVQNIE